MNHTGTIRPFIFCQILVVLLLLGSLFSCREKQTKTNEEQSVILASEHVGFISIFNGTSLTNWEGDSTYWRVVKGSIIGEITPETLLNTNTFLIYKNEFERF